MQRKGSEGVLFDSKDQQVDAGNLQDAAFLNAVVKVYCTHTAPDYSLPWQKQRQYQSTGSAFMIGDGKLLTNAHCVEHDTQVLANEVNIGYEDLSNEQVLKLNGTWIRNIHHLAHLVDSCKDKYLIFEFEDNFLVILEREAALATSGCILKYYGIPSERSSDLSEPYVDSIGHVETINQHESVDRAILDSEFGYDGLLWA